MEQNSNISISEAFSALFQEGWLSKSYIPYAIFLANIVLFALAVGLIGYGITVASMPIGLSGGVVLLVCIVALFVSYFIIKGYYGLYGRDRAFDKNAMYRDWSKESIRDFLITGAKLWVLELVQEPFKWIFNIILAIPFYLFVFVIMVIMGFSTEGEAIVKFFGDVAGMFLNVLVPLIYTFTLGIIFARIESHFIKDLTFSSMFAWGKAITCSKGVKGAFLIPLMPLVYRFFAGMGLFSVLFIFGLISALVIATGNPVFMCVAVALTIIIVLFGAVGIVLSAEALKYNLLGQYTYNVIAKEKAAAAQNAGENIQ